MWYAGTYFIQTLTFNVKLFAMETMLLGNFIKCKRSNYPHLMKIFSIDISNPTPEPVPSPGAAPDVMWPTFTPDELNYLWMGKGGDDVETKLNYRQKHYAFHQYYLPYLAFGEDMPFVGENYFYMTIVRAKS